MERLIRIFFTVVLSCIIGVCGTVWVYGEEHEENREVPEGLHAQAAVLADASNGRILWGKNEDEPMAMASTTKIMTCLIALENSKPDEVVTISEYAASMPDVQMDAAAGEKFYMDDLLYSLMLESNNDVAVAIAEHIGGSVEGFADMMNDRAAQLGCIQTCFVTPNGLDADGHCTTASELAKITFAAIQNKDFIKIINTLSRSFSNVEGSRQYHVENKNAFLHLMPGAFGVKTGFTNDAGYCFVGALEQDGRSYISVVLGSGWPPNKTYKWQDTVTLMNYGLEHYTLKEIGAEDIFLGDLSVEGGCLDTAALKSDYQKTEVLLSEYDDISIEIVKDLVRKAPIDENEHVGWIYYKVNEDIVASFPIYSDENVSEKTLGFCIKKIARQWLSMYNRGNLLKNDW